MTVRPLDAGEGSRIVCIIIRVDSDSLSLAAASLSRVMVVA